MPRSLESEKNVKAQVTDLLTRLLNEQLDIISGCRELTALYHAGHEFIPIRFVGYDSDLDHVPLPAFYSLWNKEALAKVLQEANDMYKEGVLAEASKLLEDLSESRT